MGEIPSPCYVYGGGFTTSHTCWPGVQESREHPIHDKMGSSSRPCKGYDQVLKGLVNDHNLDEIDPGNVTQLWNMVLVQ